MRRPVGGQSMEEYATDMTDKKNENKILSGGAFPMIDKEGLQRAKEWLYKGCITRDYDGWLPELLAEYAQSQSSRLATEVKSYAEVISYISEIVNGTPECHYLVIADDVQRMLLAAHGSNHPLPPLEEK